MSPKFAERGVSLATTALVAVGALLCASQAVAAGASPFGSGPIDPASPAAADIADAQAHPGPYPAFSDVAPVPKDVRPASAWRAAVYDVWGKKKQTEAEAAAIPFVLVTGETEGWAQTERSKIPADEMIGPAADAADQTEAFAAAQRARATPPPSSK